MIRGVCMTKKQILPKGKMKGEARLLLATLLLTVGVYLAFPERGLAATFPLLFVFAFAAGFCYPVLWFCSLAGGGIALLYGVMANFPVPALFAVFCLAESFLGAFSVRLIRRAIAEKKVKTVALFAFLLVISLILPLIFAGTPFAYLREREKALDYLQKNYPDQKFSRVVFYFNPSSRDYHATVYYDNEGNALSSDLIFGTTVQDGYRKAYSDYVLIRHKSDLIRVFQEREFSVTTEEGELLLERSDPVPGAYGTLSKEILPLTCYAVTFRDEKPERRDFAAACGEALRALQEEEIPFGRLTFFGLDAGKVIYRCEVTQETKPEETLSLVTRK